MLNHNLGPSPARTHPMQWHFSELKNAQGALNVIPIYSSLDLTTEKEPQTKTVRGSQRPHQVQPEL